MLFFDHIIYNDNYYGYIIFVTRIKKDFSCKKVKRVIK
jgi:hypothetical protein